MYSTDCMKLTAGLLGHAHRGFVIGHEEGYTNPATSTRKSGRANATFDSKLDTLFTFEKKVKARSFERQLFGTTVRLSTLHPHSHPHSHPHPSPSPSPSPSPRPHPHSHPHPSLCPYSHLALTPHPSSPRPRPPSPSPSPSPSSSSHPHPHYPPQTAPRWSISRCSRRR